MRSSGSRIEPGQARELIAGGALLVDVRRVDDPAPAIAGALRISPDMVPGRVQSFPRDVPIVLGCT
jgi:rhodanese-related sulfurtransferase